MNIEKSREYGEPVIKSNSPDKPFNGVIFLYFMPREAR